MDEESAIELAVEAWNKGVDEFVARLTPDVELYTPPGFPDGDVWQGREAVAAVLHEIFGSVFTGVQYKVEDTTRGPGGWLLRARESVNQERGMKLEWEEFVVMQVEGELVGRVWVFYDEAQARAQAGV
jgi:hypothetical protein